jgi:hypothetical protein
MKKTLFKYILTSILIVGVVGCEKAIDKTPTHALSQENAFKTVGDFETSLSSVYTSLRGVGYYGRNLSVIPDMIADDLVQTSESLVNFNELTDWVYTSTNGTIAETWLAGWGVIFNANVIINNIDKFANPSNQTRVNSIKGQAIALRAMAHFDLLKYFADNLDRTSTSPAIPYVDQSPLESSPASFKPARLTVTQVYDKIYADIAAARTALSNVNAPINTASAKYRIDLTALNAIQARVALYAKDWPTAITASTAVINALPLASRSVYPTIWRDQSQTEVAFAVFFSPGEFLSRLAGDVYSPPPGTNRSQFEGSPALFSQINEVNDIRFSTSVTRGFSTSALVRANSRLVVTKYNGKGTALDGVVDWKAFRTGEMYLIRAEARAFSSQSALALDDLNTLRAARINGFVNGTESGTALTDAIALERRKELFMEGHRWFDLKRLNRNINRGTITAPTTQAILAPTRREWVWPIPQGERDANPNMTQNPGY